MYYICSVVFDYDTVITVKDFALMCRSINTKCLCKGKILNYSLNLFFMKKISFLFSMLLTMALIGCSENNMTETTANGAPASIEEELTLYSAYPNVIGYKTARFLAYQELAGNYGLRYKIVKK